MEKILLGLLMLKRLTIYEIRSIIKLNFQSMCSDSLGSIQASIKKLLAGNLISCNEFVEKSVNKKRYSITCLGRETFTNWVKNPMDMSKAKNIELSKLLFMGLVPKEEQRPLITEVIKILKKELMYLENIKKNIKKPNKSVEQMLAYLEQDEEYSNGLYKATESTDNTEIVEGVERFETITLQLGIDTAKFQINWFEALKEALDNNIDTNIT